MIPREVLLDLYLKKRKSMQEIATAMNYSLNKIKYWIDKHGIKTRSISDAIYHWHNPSGDPFNLVAPKSLEEAQLFGMGVGLYWGEGTKANKNTVRLGNTDPELIKVFIKFLIKFFRIRKSDLKFGLQIFTDINPEEALDFWIKKLKIDRAQFYKVLITKSGSLGTYRKKSVFGVLTVYYNNKKLRDLLISLLPM